MYLCICVSIVRNLFDGVSNELLGAHDALVLDQLRGRAPPRDLHHDAEVLALEKGIQTPMARGRST